MYKYHKVMESKELLQKRMKQITNGFKRVRRPISKEEKLNRATTIALSKDSTRHKKLKLTGNKLFTNDVDENNFKNHQYMEINKIV